ncbi:MAG: acyl-CoA dehydrogenase family protein [Leeuwenhoekiella sp.]
MSNLTTQNNLSRNTFDTDALFPIDQFKQLFDEELLNITLPISQGGEGMGVNGGHNELLTALKSVGKRDLSTGRIYEGHLNALLLIAKYGTDAQKVKYYREATEGMLFGVWNTERNFEKLTLKRNGDDYSLIGAKTFCSGGRYIQRPLVTAGLEGCSQMFILELDQYQDLEEDFSLWKPMGMKESASCRFDFTGRKVSRSQFLGEPDEYLKEPEFSGGAIRFAAVQMGGAERIADITLEHLRKTKRTDNPYQQHRLGRISILITSGRNWLEKAAEVADQSDLLDAEVIVNHAHMVRTAIQEICEEVIKIAQKAIGVQGMMEDHPLEKELRDLTVYLKQPGPDLTLANIGKYMASKTSFDEL